MEHNAHQYRTFIARTLRENIESNTVNQFVERFSTPHDLLDSTQEELMEIHGIGKVKASQIISVIEIVKMLNTPRQARNIIHSPKDAYEVLHNDLALKNREYFVCLFLNTKNYMIAKEIISIGSLNAAIVHPRELFRSAIKKAQAHQLFVPTITLVAILHRPLKTLFLPNVWLKSEISSVYPCWII